ncbi:MAG: proline--tRNA ligase [Patescibacteria group bacterium]
MAFTKRQLPKKSESLSDWYNAVVLLAELADYGPAKGTMIFRPAGYGIWELIQQAMDKEIKKSGVENAYFPLFIPESLMHKEKEHVEGFAPQLAVVTIGGGEELKERLVVRPTSETIMYQAYARWIQSWRDLPVLINQWNNVVRWEKRTYLFLRTTEFLWQEGHCAHATHEESQERVQWGIEMYAKIYKDFLALPGVIGTKSESEKFAGGDATLTYEILMPEGKVLQGCTSHDLGQNFSKAQNIKFQDKQGQNQFVWQNSWGFSTRSIGAMLMAHGDDAGLTLPPKVAPTQAVIIPVTQDEEVLAAAKKLSGELGDVRVKVDTREGESLGFKINKWELRGVPLRIEVGKQEMASGKFRMVRRDTGEVVEGEVKGILDQIQDDMLAKQEKFLAENTHEVADYEQFKETMENKRGFIKAFWCENAECETRIKEETKASTRCLPVDAKEESGKCVYCGKVAKYKWLFALAY